MEKENMSCDRELCALVTLARFHFSYVEFLGQVNLTWKRN